MLLQHERFSMEEDKASIANDIAIVKVTKPFTVNKYVQLSTLPPNNFDSFVGKNCVICGFGRYCEMTFQYCRSLF